MPSLRVLAAALLLACIAPAASAQQSLQQRMTAEEFRATGLEKLSAAELANLERWLQRQVQEEASAATGAAVQQAREEAREQARREVAEQSAGRREAPPANEAVHSRIAGEFNGFGSGRKYTLENGQVWEQVDAARLEGVRATNPAVTVAPGFFGAWYLRIDGYNTRAKVRRVD